MSRTTILFIITICIFLFGAAAVGQAIGKIVAGIGLLIIVCLGIIFADNYEFWGQIILIAIAVLTSLTLALNAYAIYKCNKIEARLLLS